MFQATTNNIRVTVIPAYNMRQSNPRKEEYLFSYQVTIENLGEVTCQLISREWHIKDSLGNHRYVAGEGVVGEKPVLHPGESHSYRSWCPIKTPIGCMYGFFKMLLIDSNKTFDVQVPRFDLVSYPINN